MRVASSQSWFWSAVSTGVFTICVAAATDVLALAPLQYEAIPGRPFGVARLTLPPQADSTQALETNHLALIERDGRAFYPVFTNGRLRKILEDLLGTELENGGSLTVLFLFRGEEPLRLKVMAPEPVDVEIVPRRGPPRNFQRLLDRWWREYNLVAQQQISEGDFSPVVQTYLLGMLGRRLQLTPPPPRLLARGASNSAVKAPEEVRDSFQLLLGLEPLRMATIRDALMEPGEYRAVANLPLPPEIAWGPPARVEFDPKVEIEPMARHVPEEFLYLRFGRFSNYIWMSNLLRDYGGDIGGMVTLRGVRNAGDQRIEQQLALPPPASALVEMLAETLLADVAIVGRDLYLDDGAAIGLIFQARNALFGVNLTQHRKATQAKEKDRGATLTTEKIAGRDVSFLSTPDNRLRSFHVIDGDFHFVTSSRAMAQRFLEVAGGKGTLAESAEFKHARSRLPTNRDDTIFAYLSPAFFRGLLSPQYQVEVGRRLRALTDFQLLQLARLAARAERLPNDEVETLVAGGLLPTGFGRRPDGSGPIDSDNDFVDSLRGGRGTFLPVPDVELRAVTRAEANACARRTAYFEQHLRQPDPVIFAVRRTVAEGGRENLTIEGRISPLDETKYGRLLSILGPATTERIAMAPDDVVTVEAHVRGGLLDPSVPPHHLYLGVQDAVPLADLRGGGLLKTLRIIQATPGYLGAWPKPGFLDWLPFGLGGGAPDPLGYSKLPFGIWRRQWNGHSLLAFDRGILDGVAPKLAVTEVEDAAQIRLHLSNLTDAKFAAWVNGMSYQRSRQASLGNLRLLHMLAQQLQVAPKDAQDIAQRLLDAELVCPLGGEYELTSPAAGLPEWRSTKLPPVDDTRLPADYRAPLLGWFRGLDASLVKEVDHVLVHADLNMERQPNDTALPEPSSFFNLFGGAKPKPDSAKPAKNALPAPAKPNGTKRDF